MCNHISLSIMKEWRTSEHLKRNLQMCLKGAFLRWHKTDSFDSWYTLSERCEKVVLLYIIWLRMCYKLTWFLLYLCCKLPNTELFQSVCKLCKLACGNILINPLDHYFTILLCYIIRLFENLNPFEPFCFLLLKTL